jgi:predicted DNA-binding transcriptional regulator AlpA
MKRLTTNGVLEKLGYSSRETLRNMVKHGLLPIPVQDEGSTINFWYESDVDTYLQLLADKRQSKAA